MKRIINVENIKPLLGDGAEATSHHLIKKDSNIVLKPTVSYSFIKKIVFLTLMAFAAASIYLFLINDYIFSMCFFIMIFAIIFMVKYGRGQGTYHFVLNDKVLIIDYPTNFGKKIETIRFSFDDISHFEIIGKQQKFEDKNGIKKREAFPRIKYINEFNFVTKDGSRHNLTNAGSEEVIEQAKIISSFLNLNIHYCKIKLKNTYYWSYDF